MTYDPKIVSNYIRQAAMQRGIDPHVALAVASSEGLNQYTGDGGSSFGPFQLHYGGVAKGGNAVGGLGDTFTRRTGLDARDPNTWQAQVNFALDEARRGGWGPWHGWKGDARAGIGAPYSGPLKAGGAIAQQAPAGLLSYAPMPDIKSDDPIAALLSQPTQKPDPIGTMIAQLEQPKQPQAPVQADNSMNEDFLRQMQDFHNMQHMRAVQGLLSQ
jgi:hypothetical protein